jgi:hypothetical protein
MSAKGKNGKRGEGMLLSQIVLVCNEYLPIIAVKKGFRSYAQERNDLK